MAKGIAGGHQSFHLDFIINFKNDTGMKLFIAGPPTYALFDEKFGGIAGFSTAWAESNPAIARDPKTIYGWIANGLPRNRETIFAFFGMLDTDPLALLDLERNRMPQSFGRLRRSFLLGGASAGAFKALFELYHPGPAWPSNSLTQQFYGRDWVTSDFVHSANTLVNAYAVVHVRDAHHPTQPRAWHIAYRRIQNNDGMWRPYGTIIACGGQRILIHENGYMQTEIADGGCPDFRFQTYFGPSPIEFRLASLSPFNIEIDFPNAETGPLRFIG